MRGVGGAQSADQFPKDNICLRPNLGLAAHPYPGLHIQPSGVRLEVYHTPCTAPRAGAAGAELPGFTVVPPAFIFPFRAPTRPGNLIRQPTPDVLPPLLRLLAAMSHQYIITPLLIPSPSHVRDLVRHASDFSAMPPIKTPPIIFRRRWEALLRYAHLSKKENIAPIWEELATAGWEESRNTLDNA